MEWIELTLRWTFAGQMFFWGLNAFFNWLAISPADPGIQDFVEACIRTGFIMPAVKLLEVVGGILLFLGLLVPSSLLAFAPLVFVISALHIRFNRNPWPVVLPITGTYVPLLFFHWPAFLG